MIFSDKYLKSKAISNTAFEKAKLLATADNINILSHEKNDKNKSRELNAIILEDDKKYSVNLCFSYVKPFVYNYSCNCPANTNNTGMCKHTLACLIYTSKLLIYTENLPIFNTKVNVDKKQNSISNNKLAVLINECVLKYTSNIENNKQYEVIPYIYIYNNKLYLRLKISEINSKQYFIKNVEDFLNAINLKQKVYYGKNLDFVHCKHMFTNESWALIKCLIKNKNYINSNDKLICVDNYFFDDILELLLNKEVNFYINDDNGQEKLTKIKINSYDDYNAKLLIKSVPNKLCSISIKHMRNVYYGGDNYLLMLSNNNAVLFNSKNNYLKKFITIINENKLENHLTPNELNNFINYVVPNFNNLILLDDLGNNNFELVDKPKLNIDLYFDKLNNSIISLYINYVYNDAQYSFYPNKNKDISQNRDFVLENNVENIISNYFDFNEAQDNLLLQNNEEKQFELLTIAIPQLTGLANIYTTERFKSIKIHSNNDVRLGIKLDSGLVNIDINIADINQEELSNIYKAFLLNKKYFRLTNGSFINLRESAIKEFANLAKKLNINPNEITNNTIKLPQYRSLLVNELLKETKQINFERDGGFKKLVKEMKNIEEDETLVPRNLKPVLRNYQEHGFRWLKTLANFGFGGVLADDMGLGKTLEVLSLLQYSKEENIGNELSDISLVVCPASLVINWVEETKKFTPEINAIALLGNAMQRKNIIRNLKGVDLLISSYDSIKRDYEFYKEIGFKYLIADEAQNIKNHNTFSAKSIKTIKAENRFALSGTPIENNIAELWSIFDFIMPNYLYSYPKFKHLFEYPIVINNDEVVLKNLNKIISPFMLRRLKSDVLYELPEKTETILYAQMEQEQTELYKDFVKSTKIQVNNVANNNTIQMLALLTRLRQICCDPKLLNSEEYFNIDSAKKQLCLEVIKNSIDSGHRILLFSNFTSMLDILANELNFIGIENISLLGSTAVNKRQSLVDKFNNSNIPVFLISIKAGGTGLNLVGADIVIHYDPWWNTSVENQATDRSYRMGQKNAVQVYRLIAKDTIEEDILKLQNKKQDLMQNVLENEDILVSKISKEQLLSIIK